MSSPSRRHPPLEVRERATCMCASGEACSVFAPGHALHLIQARLAAATPSEWRDAVVAAVDPGSGEIVLHSIDDGTPVVLWHAAALDLTVGEPVAIHARYAVLAARGRRLNVAPIA